MNTKAHFFISYFRPMKLFKRIYMTNKKYKICHHYFFTMYDMRKLFEGRKRTQNNSIKKGKVYYTRVDKTRKELFVPFYS